MKKKYKTRTFIIILFAFFSLSLAACGGSTATNGGGNGNNGGGNGGDGSSGIAFDTGSLAPGQSASITFDTTGSTDYVCTFHTSQMQGSVTVEDGASTEDVTVTVDEYSFSPASITIGPGARVTWVNQGNMNHTATSQ